MIDVVTIILGQECRQTRDRTVNEYETGISDKKTIGTIVPPYHCNTAHNELSYKYTTEIGVSEM